MKNMYLCEICGKAFETEKECKEHEKTCNIDIKIKCISLIWKFNKNIKQSNYLIEIVEYQKARYFNGVYKLCRWYDNTDWQELVLDKIIHEEYLIIYTMDFSKETEQKYINLLKSNEQQCIKHDQEILVKQLKCLSNNLQIERKFENE